MTADHDDQLGFLLGTDALPARVPIAAGVDVPVAFLVNQAFSASRLTVREWNGLPIPRRDALILAARDALIAEHEYEHQHARLRWLLNPCDMARLRVLAPVGDALAWFWLRTTAGTECPCCLGARLVAILVFAGAVGATAATIWP